ncbi:tripartite tricarboxylate transporter substrate binding protein [Comamonas antarctica]|uniref:Tripartite tricarboxylate transporter substrate binding protein n=1 Tax=Comamonas antarctica TaxID=2743470 RepID=A0A6N1X410_9BURK|nr:tripartite tricarboxylate transporter substrate binding protein [Comamonas antarctica]QKV53023.1 tripartite tricarboxylate transporter substrate binding protein [Comamonas antarctica]
MTKQRNTLRIWQALGVAAVAGTGVLPAAWAQAWPAKPITMVVPFPPGGPTDIVARLLAQNIAQQLGQSIVVDNRPGANGNIGNAAVAKAAPDGYTVLYNTSSIALSPALYKKLSYDVNKELAPVALTAVVPLALVTRQDLPAKSVPEFMAWLKAQGGKASYGSAGNGNVTHLAAFQMLHAARLEASHIPYKGSAPADLALAGGQIDFLTDTINSVIPFIKSKHMNLLAVTTAERMSLFPEVPTLAESGLRGFEAGAWQGIMVPAGTPADVIARLNTAVNRALKNPEVLAKLAQQGTEALGSSPEQYGAYLQKELKRWKEVVAVTGVSLD